ncbi:lipoprotein [Leminorella grimontii]|uniref:Lipoprotein n=2 Tax=Leminorella grimontii TaxID=82981 RepID=A0AAV5N216_9GAMM|nr:lytic murein transglycosylase [Leminorella grimontii]GKX54796.1 lipoprotein [Leminorella grimontii]
MMKLSAARLLSAGMLLTASALSCAWAQSTSPVEAQEEAKFRAYVETLKEKALTQGITQQTVERAFANVYYLKRVVTADQNQPEKKLTLDDYLRRSLSAAKIKRARAAYVDYKKQLDAVSKRSGVPANYIVALWGSESGFGRFQGKEDIVSALSTLAFDGRREAFFTDQLMAALQILQQGHIAPERFKGSWAGAMGQCQFMPTSFLKYGMDGNGDGKVDIWQNTDDVFASIANYLATEGWNAKEGWGIEVTVAKDFKAEWVGLEDERGKTVGQWKKLGIRAVSPAKIPNGQRAWIVQPDDAQGRTFMVFNNFRTLMHWNRSTYFGINVGMLADSVVKK